MREGNGALEPAIDEGAIEALVQGRHGDPFALLGPHEAGSGTVIRALLPGAAAVAALAPSGELLAEFRRAHEGGLFEARIAAPREYRLCIDWHGVVQETEDPYAFPLLLGALDVHLLAEGRHRLLAECLGAQPMELCGVAGVRFAVWAPNARRVSVIGSFNFWDGRRHPMRLRRECGVWEIFVPRLAVGALYKYEVLGVDGTLSERADPLARAAEAPPATASIVAGKAPFAFSDTAWQAARAGRSDEAPLAIYEVHAPSWRRHADGSPLSWAELADALVPYARALGFTHIELMPVMLHPFGGSWGYQPLGQFVPMPELGPPEEFAAFVDRCHGTGLGVILDWVPAHFPGDGHGLVYFDGTHLYEHADPKEGFHQDWNTYIYNLGRNEVRGFLIGSALHWLEHYHVDALRVDAVASMLYRDYSRKEGEWVPNMYGGRENLEAVSFLRELSEVVGSRCPGSLLIAEESTAWPGVSRPVSEGGLGFDYKWNMGWMHDSLHYMEEESINRRWHHDSLTFGLVYAFSEKFVLPLSHDEVVYGKGSLIGKMRGDRWQKFANLRAYFGFMWTHPGKKLIFMGGEIAQEREWNHDHPLDWWLLDRPEHTGIQALVRDLNQVYRNTPALHRHDADGSGFRWVVLLDREQSVFAYLRFGDAGDRPVLAVCNFTPVPRYAYRLGVSQAGGWREIMNTDAGIYGGSNLGNGGWVMAEDQPWGDCPASVSLVLPPLATVIFEAA